METKKIVGYILLAAGLLLVVYTLYQSYSIFAGKISAPLIFKTPTQQIVKAKGLLDVQGQINEAVGQQISQMLPVDTITKTLNLISWSILAGILIFGGGQISGIGVKLIK